MSTLYSLLPLALALLIIWGLVLWLRPKDKAKESPLGLTPYGFGGFLLVLGVVLAYIGPGQGLLQITSAVAQVEKANPEILKVPGWGHLKSFTAVVLFITTGIGWYVVFQLRNKYVPRSATLAKWLFLTVPFAAPIANSIAAAYFLNTQIPDALAKDLAAGLLSCVVWFSYLHFSKRVLNTYYGGDKSRRWSFETQDLSSSSRPIPGLHTPYGGFVSVGASPQVPVQTQPPSTYSAAARPAQARLQELQQLHADGLISNDDYAAQKERILREL